MERRSIPQSTVLILDDDADLVKKYASALSAEGHFVVASNTWEDARKLIDAQNIDLVVLQYAFSDIDSETIITAIKNISSRIRIIVLFSKQDNVCRREFLEKHPIQGCHEKEEGIEKFFLWFYTVLKILTIRDLLHQGITTIKSQVKIIEKNKEGLRYIIDAMPETISRLQPLDKFIRGVLIQLNGFIESEHSFLATVDENEQLILLVGTGKFDMNEKSFLSSEIVSAHIDTIEAVRTNKKPIIDEYHVYLPLIAKDSVIGIFYLEKTASNIKELEIEMLKLFSSQAAITIENSNLFKLATVDGLTGLYVRRYFLQRFQEVLQFASRFGGQPISLLMFDIDHFKPINDTYGHPEGDKVLARVSSILRQSVRATDVTGRLGGEEFALLLINTPQDKALRLAESIRKKIASLEFVLQGTTLGVTISIGLCTAPSYVISQESLHEKPLAEIAKHDVRRMLTATDQALYKSKETGRNKVTVAAPLDPS
jgi:diguanylate cyclase (GGDEF)-like protein